MPPCTAKRRSILLVRKARHRGRSWVLGVLGRELKGANRKPSEARAKLLVLLVGPTFRPGLEGLASGLHQELRCSPWPCRTLDAAIPVRTDEVRMRPRRWGSRLPGSS